MAYDTVTVAQLLQQVLQPETAQDATERVKGLMKDNAFTGPLAIQMAQNPNVGVRQLAAVLLRRKLAKAWGSMSRENKIEMKQMLLSRLVEDPAHLVRLSIAHVVSSLGKLILMEWKTELFTFLQNCSNSEHESYREVAQVVFSSILDAMGDTLVPLFDDFASIFLKGLEDPTSSAVRVAAMKGVSALACCAESAADFARLRRLIPSMVAVTQEACAAGKQDVVVFVLEVFDDLAEQSDALKPEYLPDLIRFMLGIASNESMETGVREQALNFIHSIGKYKPKIITKNNLVPEILKVVIPMALKPDPEDADEDELTPHRIAAQCIDSLALNLPSRFVFEPIVQYLSPMIQRSSNPWEQRGAIILLGVMSEGCEDIMRQKVNELLPPVLSAFSNPNPLVKSAAGVALGQMAEYLQPEISQSHQMTMKVLLNAMRDPATIADENVHEKLCYAVELFCDHLEEFEIESYLAELMPALMYGLTTAKANKARENCIGAIGSAAQAGKANFVIYIPQVMGVLEEVLNQSNEEFVLLKSRAIACAGSIIQSVPREATQLYHEKLVHLVFEGLEHINHFDLREASYRFLGCMASALKDDFAPLIQKALPYALASLMNEDGIETQYEEEDENTDPLNGVDSDEDSEDERRIRGIHIRTGFIDEQTSALDLLSCLFRNVSGTFMAPWLKNTFDSIQIMHKYFHSGIRQCVPNLMQAVLINVHHTFLPSWAPKVDAESPTNKINHVSGSTPETYIIMTTSDNRGWIPGLPCKSLLNEHTIQLWIEKLWPLYYAMLTDDEDKEVIADVCSSLGELLELLGPHLLEGSTINCQDVQTCLVNTANQIFAGKHACQKFETEEIDQDEESRAIEEYLFEGVSSLISGLAQTMGKQFQTAFSTLHPKILLLAKHRKSSAYRCIGIGCYADIFRTMGAVATQFVEPIIEPALEGAKQSIDISLRRNSAYCLGAIVEFGAALPFVEIHLLEILKVLHSLFEENSHQGGMREADLCVRDNAVAAVGRMLRGCTRNQIPFDDIIPVFLKALPLKSDFEESEGILRTLLHIYYSGTNSQLLTQYQTDFFKAMIGELLNGSVTKEVKEQVKSILRSGVQTLGVEHPTFVNIKNQDKKYNDFLISLIQ